MITQYIAAAMKQSQFELMENGRYFATIPACRGCWAEGASIEECRTELQSTLEDWILLKVGLGDTMPVIDGVDINAQPVYAEAD